MANKTKKEITLYCKCVECGEMFEIESRKRTRLYCTDRCWSRVRSRNYVRKKRSGAV